MKKLPCPEIRIMPDTDGTNSTVLHFEWDTISFQMYEDQALLLARSIHDVLEEFPDTDGGPLSPWGET